MKINHLLVAGLLLGAPLLASAQINVGIGINVREAPPPVREEVINAAPGPDYFWIGGHWRWHGRWIWEAGHWDRRPGYSWVAGRWEHRNGGYIWVEGRWTPYVNPGPGGLVVNEAPPPLIVEHYGRAPGPDYVWVGGHWGWHGGWVWTHGHWDRHPHWHPGGAWIAGRWDHRGNGYIWVEGHFN